MLLVFVSFFFILVSFSYGAESVTECACVVGKCDGELVFLIDFFFVFLFFIKEHLP